MKAGITGESAAGRPADARAAFGRFAAVAVALLTAVHGGGVGASEAVDPRAAGGKRELAVMTRNLYQGADVARIIEEANPYMIPVRVAETLARVVANDFPARARGLAAEVAGAAPDVLGLQEATLIQTQSPGDSLTLPPDLQSAAADVLFDYVEILLEAMAERGLRYSVVCATTNYSIELPMVVADADGIRLDDVRLTDRVVLLARDDLPEGHLRVTATATGHFTTLLPITVAGAELQVLRGWCAADLLVRGRQVRVVNAHLEAWHPLVRLAQAAELIAGPAGTGANLICMGDFNSNANSTGWDGYGLLLASGLADVWCMADGEAAPPTWGREEDLAQDRIPLIERLDLVLHRGELVPIDRGVTGADEADRVLSTLGEARLLWHSDHAGVNATFAMP